MIHKHNFKQNLKEQIAGFLSDKCEIVQMSVHVTVNKIEEKKAQNKGQ